MKWWNAPNASPMWNTNFVLSKFTLPTCWQAADADVGAGDVEESVLLAAFVFGPQPTNTNSAALTSAVAAPVRRAVSPIVWSGIAAPPFRSGHGNGRGPSNHAGYLRPIGNMRTPAGQRVLCRDRRDSA